MLSFCNTNKIKNTVGKNRGKGGNTFNIGENRKHAWKMPRRIKERQSRMHYSFIFHLASICEHLKGTFQKYFILFASKAIRFNNNPNSFRRTRRQWSGLQPLGAGCHRNGSKVCCTWSWHQAWAHHCVIPKSSTLGTAASHTEQWLPVKMILEQQGLSLAADCHKSCAKKG